MVQRMIRVLDFGFIHRPTSHELFPLQRCACTCYTCYSSVMHDCCLIRSLVEDNQQAQTTTGLQSENNQTTVIAVSVSTAVVICTLIITGGLVCVYFIRLRSKQDLRNKNSAQG